MIVCPLLSAWLGLAFGCCFCGISLVFRVGLFAGWLIAGCLWVSWTVGLVWVYELVVSLVDGFVVGLWFGVVFVDCLVGVVLL